MLRLLNLSRSSTLIRTCVQKHITHRIFHSSCIRNNTYLKRRIARNALDKYKIGKVLHGFEITEIANIDELFLTAIRLTHMSTGAQYLHLARDDTNNVFCIGFRTTPMDSTGLPHILEHTTLCGSERYPCRDPFFKMLRRSLATFMNAMTGPDYTIYPFSTQDITDFRNLQSVYLDSVFRPNLREMDFRQEGWRLEHADVNNKDSPIVFKGVVFNEMKGVFNDNQAILAEYLLNTILPSHTYSVIAGGDPLIIPTLQYVDLLNFHSKYYHPSNARFYSYGNFPLEDHLKFIHDRYLFLSDRIDTTTSIVPAEKRWEKPRRENISCRPDPLLADPSRYGTLAIAYLCNDITDVQMTFEMYVLSQLLLRGPNAILYKSLVESEASTSFGAVTGFDSQCKDTMFVMTLQGVKPKNFEKVEALFADTVEEAKEGGFKKDHIEAILHGIELQVKHQTSNFGLNMLFNLTSLWNHDGDLIQSLRINDAVHRFMSRMRRDPTYLQKLIELYFSQNNHKLTVTMLPDEKYDENKLLAEQNLLDSQLKALSHEEKEQIFVNGQILLSDQEKKEDIEVLPTLEIKDLKDEVDKFDIFNIEISGVPLQISIQPTNGISYYRAIFNTQALPSELKHLLPLFNYIVSRMGTQNYDYRVFDHMMEMRTGGLNFMNHIAEHKSNELAFEEGIIIESYCLDRYTNDMWKLWTELINNVRLKDPWRFKTLVKMKAADLTNGISHAGHMYAMSSAASLISPTSRMKENLSGLQYIKRMKHLAQIRDFTFLLRNMEDIANQVLNKKHLRSALNISEKYQNDIRRDIQTFYNSLKGEAIKPYIISTDISIENDVKKLESGNHHVLPYTVNYCSKTVLTVPYVHLDYAPLRILSKLISSIYLHPEIREKGGAYGGGAKLTRDGIFAFYSYRDPNSTRTFDLFDKTYDFLSQYPLLQRHLNEAKLGIFQLTDAPVPPSNRGLINFTHDLTDEDFQNHRNRLRAVTLDQLMEVAKKYLKPGQPDIKVSRSLIGPANVDITTRYAENWTVLYQEDFDEAEARLEDR